MSIGPILRFALMGLTALLAVIAALAVANLYDARQDYEDELSAAYELEAASARLLAAGVIEEVALTVRGSTEARRRAAATFDQEAAAARGLAEGDAESERLIEARVAAQRQARRATRGRRGGARGPDPTASALLSARTLSADLTARQRRRRAEARDEAGDRTTRAVITVSLAGGLTLLGAGGIVALLVAGMRRPLDELVGATKRLSQGDLDRRVRVSGPRELRDLGVAFNKMAEELHRAQRRVEAERHKLEVTVQSLGDALIATDAAGIVTTANPRAAELVPQLVPGARLGDGDPLPPASEALDREVLVESDERTLAVTAAPLGGEGEGGGTVWTIRDISERTRLERLKSDFVATASHELRSPLTSIKGFAELLSRTPKLDSRQREFVEVIVLSTNRLVDLVNDLLEVARAEAGRIELHRRPVDLGEQVREIATLMTPRLEDKRQRLDVAIPPGLPRAFADPARVRQVLTNLLTNAHLYTDEGGTLSIRLGAEETWVVMEVSDTGQGMTAAEMEHAFDRFYRGGDGARVPGTGLGLAIVKSLVELHEGHIGVSSEPGRGTTFTVRLPPEPQAGVVGAPRLAIRGRRVLVVDDEPEIANLIVRQLEAFDVTAVVVGSGAEAVRSLREGSFDAVTLDLFMPGMSGFEVLRAMRADPALRQTPVVVVSVLSGREVLAGEWSVSKPIDSEELADALGGAVLAGRTRALIVGREELRTRLVPALAGLNIDYRWVESAAAAAVACDQERFEIALVDAGTARPQAVLEALDLRGRRLGKGILLFSNGDDAPGLGKLETEPVRIDEVANAIVDVLSGRPSQ